MFGFKQIKEFNTKTVTQEVAAELCAIGGLWNTYRQPPYNEFIITNLHKRGSINGIIVDGQPDGVKIESKRTRHIFFISDNGSLSCYNEKKDDDEYQIISRNIKTGFEQISTRTLEYHCNQIEYVAKLCELGFYKFDLRQEKIKRLLNK